MTDIAIRVENLSKQYRIGGPQARYKTIRESLTEAVQNRDRETRGWGDKEQAGGARRVFSLSPPLPLSLSRYPASPSRRRARPRLRRELSRTIHGRVGSLLEVDSGFNPELIGQENPGKGFICNLDKDS